MADRSGGGRGSGVTRPTLRTLVIAAAVVVLDQATKAWAVAALDDGPIELVGDAVRLDLTRNPGSAFSLFSGGAPFLALIAAALAVVLLRLARRERDPLLGAALALVLGGAVGNLVDRVVRDPGVLEGAVVDFVDIGAWPTFNVADAAITVGAVILVWRGWLVSSRDGEGTDEGAGEGTGDDEGTARSGQRPSAATRGDD